MSVRQMTPVYKLRSGVKPGEKHPDTITVYVNACGEYFAKSVKHSEYVDIKGYTYMADDVQKPKTPYSKDLAKKLCLVRKYGVNAKVTGYTVEEYSRKTTRKAKYTYETKINSEVKSHATFEDAENHIKANGGIGILTVTHNGNTKEYRYGEKKNKHTLPYAVEVKSEPKYNGQFQTLSQAEDHAKLVSELSGFTIILKENGIVLKVYYPDGRIENRADPVIDPAAPAEPAFSPSSAFSPTTATADPAKIWFNPPPTTATADPAEPITLNPSPATADPAAPAEPAAPVKKKTKKKSSGRTVEQYATLLKMQTRENQGLGFFGPAGTGKTYTVYQIAEHMGVPCYLQGKVSHPSELSGFVDAMGNYHTTPLRTAFENGGILLIDEFDSWDSDVVVAINSAIASRKFAFADGKEIAAHEDLMFVFTANTQFGGCVNGYERSPMDISTINRAIWFKIDYDFELETELYGRELANFAKNAREVLTNENVIGIISMRNMAAYNNMIAAGFSKQDAIRFGLLSTINDTDCVNRLADMAEYSL